LKNRRLPLAFFNMNANNPSRQRAMPSSLEAMTVAAEEVGGAHRAEVQLIQMAQLQRLGHVRLIHEAKVQDHPEEAFAVGIHLKAPLMGQRGCR
jgi:hypothetical protein